MKITQYLQYLKSFSDEPIYYCPNPGNAGDSLIAHATFQVFRKNNINYQIVNLEEFEPKNKILIYAGGGNLVNNYYGHARKIIETFHPHVKKLVVLPHTINTHEDLLKELGNNVEIICREEISYKYVKKVASKANVLIMDDLAFSLDVNDTLSQKPISLLKSISMKAFFNLKQEKSFESTIPSPKTIFRNNIIETFKMFERMSNKNNKNILNCFRIDGEKSNIDIPKNNIDLSLKFQYGTFNEEIAAYGSHKLLNIINQYDEIKTNRLHLAIAGTLLGKSVKFYSNSYYKCRAVYEYSMQNKFPNVQWIK